MSMHTIDQSVAENRQRILLSQFFSRVDIVAAREAWQDRRGAWKFTPRPVVGDNPEFQYLTRHVEYHVLGPATRRNPRIRYRNDGGGVTVSSNGDRIGSYCLSPDNTCRWVCLDFDGAGHAAALADPQAAVIEAFKRASALEIPAHIERSFSGVGFHLWVFFETPIPAASARRIGLAIAPEGAPLTRADQGAQPSCGRGIEIFPKQIELTGKRYGNMVWLPWWWNADPANNAFMRLAGEVLEPYEPSDLFRVAPTATIMRALETAPELRKATVFTARSSAGNASSYTPADVDAAEIAEAVSYIPNHAGIAYDEYLAIGMGIHDALPNATGLDIWQTWCAGYPYNDADDNERKWETFRDGGGVTRATIYKAALNAGWKPRPKIDLEDAQRMLDREPLAEFVRELDMTPERREIMAIIAASASGMTSHEIAVKAEKSYDSTRKSLSRLAKNGSVVRMNDGKYVISGCPTATDDMSQRVPTCPSATCETDKIAENNPLGLPVSDLGAPNGTPVYTKSKVVGQVNGVFSDNGTGNCQLLANSANSGTLQNVNWDNPTKPTKPVSHIESLSEQAINSRSISDLAHTAWVLHFNRQPNPNIRSLYINPDWKICRIIEAPDQSNHFIQILTEDQVHHHIDKLAHWQVVGESSAIIKFPPREIAKAWRADPHPRLPLLRSISSIPMFDATGAIIASNGYNESLRTFFIIDQNIQNFLSVPPSPPAESVEKAAQFLIYELLGDFPFVAECDRTNTLAALILPFIRPLIESATPLHFILAPAAGTGKSLLAGAISHIYTGMPAEMTTLSTSDEENRKKITTLFNCGARIVVFDNVKNGVYSTDLASAITSKIWKDRILGGNTQGAWANDIVWIGTGNNTDFSQENARRVCPIRLDAKTDRPFKRTKFRHKNLESWIAKNRGELIQSILILVQNWIASGRKDGSFQYGSFESWASTMSGILEAAEIPHFMDNAEELLNESDSRTLEWRAAVLWCASNLERDRAYSPAELAALFTSNGLLTDAFGNCVSDRSVATKLGNILKQNQGAVVEHYRFERARGRTMNVRALWRLVDLNADATDPAKSASNTGASKSSDFDLSLLDYFENTETDENLEI